MGPTAASNVTGPLPGFTSSTVVDAALHPTSLCSQVPVEDAAQSSSAMNSQLGGSEQRLESMRLLVVTWRLLSAQLGGSGAVGPPAPRDLFAPQLRQPSQRGTHDLYLFTIRRHAQGRAEARNTILTNTENKNNIEILEEKILTQDEKDLELLQK